MVERVDRLILSLESAEVCTVTKRKFFSLFLAVSRLNGRSWSNDAIFCQLSVRRKRTCQRSIAHAGARQRAERPAPYCVHLSLYILASILLSYPAILSSLMHSKKVCIISLGFWIMSLLYRMHLFYCWLCFCNCADHYAFSSTLHHYKHTSVSYTYTFHFIGLCPKLKSMWNKVEKISLK